MNYNLDYVGNRNRFFAFSIVITILGILTLTFLGFNFGVDFKAGTSLDISINKSITKPEAAEVFNSSIGSEPNSLTIGGDDNKRISSRFDRVISESERIKIVDAFSAKFGEGTPVEYEENTVDVGMAKELGVKAMWAVFFASLGIIIYVSIRFEWRFAIAAVVALLHDAFIVISLFSIFRLEVNLPFLAAILTIIGYSINDTIVIFDRIRENLRFAKIKSFADLSELVNRSIRQTMIRSMNTVLTVLIAATCLFVFGSEAIRLFSLAMMLGLFCGAYSSIFIASQIWIILKNATMNSKKTAIAKEQL